MNWYKLYKLAAPQWHANDMGYCWLDLGHDSYTDEDRVTEIDFDAPYMQDVLWIFSKGKFLTKRVGDWFKEQSQSYKNINPDQLTHEFIWKDLTEEYPRWTGRYDSQKQLVSLAEHKLNNNQPYRNVPSILLRQLERTFGNAPIINFNT